jgi:hypothetical protein
VLAIDEELRELPVGDEAAPEMVEVAAAALAFFEVVLVPVTRELGAALSEFIDQP